MQAQRSGGEILVEVLRLNGTELIFCVPGESFLPVLDALQGEPTIRTIVTRHEGAASNMAEAYGKLTGRPGICFATRGPGATHAANGVHTARQDSTPMILFVGQVETGKKGREAFQEISYPQMFGGEIAKWVTEIDRVERIAEIVSHAFVIACSGRPGPVVIGLPEDVLFSKSDVIPLHPVRISHAAVEPKALDELARLLAKSRSPLVILGGSLWDEEACQAIQKFVHAFDLPVAASFRRQDLFDNRDPHYAGMLGLGVCPRLAERVANADLLLVIGSRLSDTVTNGYTLIEPPEPKQTLVHIYPDSSELGRIYRTSLPIHSALANAARALASLPAPSEISWTSWTRSANADYLARSTPVASPHLQGVDLAQVVAHLSDTLPDNAIVANGAGNYTLWVHRFYRYRRSKTCLAPVNGAMGYGLPAAIAAKLRSPEKVCVCIAGDGCFMMYGQELATAVQYGVAVIVIVVNNGMLATIRMHQEREFPGRPYATQLRNPDFVALAKAYGAHAERVERTEAFGPAFARAMNACKPALIELLTDPRQVTPAVRID